MSSPEGPLPFVSVIVPTRDRPELLTVALRGLCRQSYPSECFEVLIVEDGGSPRSEKVVGEQRDCLASVRYLVRPAEGVNACRNAGLAAAAGELIVFTDDDVDPPATWLEELVRGTLRHPEAACFGGPVRIRFEGREPQMCGEHSISKGEVDLGPDERSLELVRLIGANLAIRTETLRTLGGFDERVVVGAGADGEWQHRLLASGGQIYYIPSAWLWHRRTADMLRRTRLLRVRFRRGMDEVLYRRNRARRGTGRGELSKAAVHLRHAWTERCWSGLLEASNRLGTATGLLLDRFGLHPLTRHMLRRR